MPVAAAKSALTSHIDGLRQSALWLDGCSGLIIAVSGGPDSLALTLMAAEICAEQKMRFEAVVVDHGLRAEAAAEAGHVVKTLTNWGIRGRCLRVSDSAPSAGKSAWARQHRLELLCDYARQTASAVLFAHHYDDQAETVAMRLARGSTVRGLSAIAAVRIYQGVLFARPFLGLRKADLVAICMAYKAVYITDPSNTDQAFERVRIRTWLQQPQQSDLRQQLVQLASLSSRLSAPLLEACDKWCAEHIIFTFRLRAHINLEAFLLLDKVARNFILRHCFTVIGGQPYPVSDDRLDQVQTRLAPGVKSTTGGCVVQVSAERITIIAEFGRLPEPELNVQAGRVYRFDKRWLITAAQDGVVRRLGPLGWAQRSQLSGLQPVSSWTARMGAMIPVLHGLDGRLHCPHFNTHRSLYSIALSNRLDKEVEAKEAFYVTVLPLDRQVELKKADLNQR